MKLRLLTPFKMIGGCLALVTLLTGCADPIPTTDTHDSGLPIRLEGLKSDGVYLSKDLADVSLSGSCSEAGLTAEVRLNQTSMGKFDCTPALRWSAPHLNLSKVADGIHIVSARPLHKMSDGSYQVQIATAAARRIFKNTFAFDRTKKAVSFVGRTPVTTLSGGSQIVDAPALTDLFQNLGMSFFQYPVGKKFLDRKIFLTGLEDDVLKKLPSDGRIKIVPWADIGRSLPRNRVYEAKVDSNGNPVLTSGGAYTRIPAGEVVEAGCGQMKTVATDKSCGADSDFCTDTWGRDTHGVRGKGNGLKDWRAIVKSDAIAEITNYAKLMKKYPKIFPRMAQDDAFANRQSETFLNLANAKALCKAAKDEYANFKLDFIVYCERPQPKDMPTMTNRYSDVVKDMSKVDWNSPAWQVQVAAQALKDPDLDACLGDFVVFNQGKNVQDGCGMARWENVDSQNMETCIFEAAKVPGHNVQIGVYSSAYARLTFEDRIHNIEEGLKLTARNKVVGAEFFLTPVADSIPSPIEDAINARVYKYLRQRFDLE